MVEVNRLVSGRSQLIVHYENYEIEMGFSLHFIMPVTFRLSPVISILQSSSPECDVMAQIPFPSKSTLAASTIPAMVYLGYVIMTKTTENSDKNFNTSSHLNCSTSSQSNFNSQLQDKLYKVQRSRLDPIEEESISEKDYWRS